VATSAGEVEVKLTLSADDFKRAIAASQTQVQDFGSVLQGFAGRLAAAFSFAAIADFFKKSLDAYAQNELAITRLVAALNNQGTATVAVRDHLVSYAEALQDATGTSKNAIIEAERLLVTFGLQGVTLEKVTQATLDLSAATGIDLQRAALLLGKAYEGQTSSLSRYGVVVNQHIPLNERFAAVMNQVNQRFGGAAQAQAETYAGRVRVMGTAFAELQERLGQFLVGPAGGLVTMLTNLIRLESSSIDLITKASSEMGGFGNVLKVVGIELLRTVLDSITNIVGSLLGLLSHLPLVGTRIGDLKTKLDGVNKALNTEIDQWQASAGAAAEAAANKAKAVKLQVKEIVEIAVVGDGLIEKSMKDRLEEEAKIRNQYAVEAKNARKDFVKFFTTTEAEMWNFATQMSDTFFKGFGDGFAKMVIEGKNFGASIKQVFKDMAEAAISWIVQLIAKMIALWAVEQLTGLGPATFGIQHAFSGAVAEGGMINEPSVITGLRTGRKLLAGEAGPEMIVPTSGGNQTAGEMGGMPSMGGGGNITINISGQMIQGDANSWNRLMRDQIIPQIRRYTMSNPTGPFNRTRGAA